MIFLNGKCLFVISTLIYSTAAFYVYILDDSLTTLVPPKRDLNETDLQEALNMDRGWYTTELFRYDNAQDMGLQEDLTGRDQCYNEYIRCLTSDETNPKPVCAYNKWKPKQNHEDNGFRDFRSICDVMHFNCRWQKRVFRVLENGKCIYHTSKKYYYKSNEKFDVHQT